MKVCRAGKESARRDAFPGCRSGAIYRLRQTRQRTEARADFSRVGAYTRSLVAEINARAIVPDPVASSLSGTAQMLPAVNPAKLLLRVRVASFQRTRFNLR